MVAQEEVCKLKLSKSAWITILVAAILMIGFVSAGYYYYVIPSPPTLRILYANSKQMFNDIASKFKTWYGEQYGRQVELELIATVPQTALERVTNPFRKPEAEIWWGGPLSLFKKAYGNLLPYNSGNKMNTTTCHFCPLMDLEQSTPRWYAASLHGLGVMYNRYVLDGLNLTVPKNWEDLVEIEKYEENVTMVDPTRSEYSSPFIMLILQSQDWTSGWEYLVKLSAFLKHFDNDEAESTLKVASGYLSIAIVPDFYAYERMALPISGINFTYLDATVLQPDPIAIIKRGVYLEEAKAFIDFILTKDAQDVIGKYRLPIHENATVSSPRINPFNDSFPYVVNYNKTFEEIGEEIVKDYYKAWITERHGEEPSIKTAWKEIKEADNSSQLAWNNFTFAANYTKRVEIDTIYNMTNGWNKTDTVTSEIIDGIITNWREASESAYQNAIDNARKSK